jgi:hypothetical protein
MRTETTEKTPRTKITRSGGLRWKGWSLALFGVALLLALAPAAQAAQNAPAHVTITAPFVGATGVQSQSTSSSGCGAGKVTHHPFFDAATGGVGFSARSHAMGCAPGYGDSGFAEASETVTVPITVPSGNDVIHAKWSIHATLSSSIGRALCTLLNAPFSDCSTEALSELSGYAYLEDATNGTYYSAENYYDGASTSSYLDAYCSYGNCTIDVAGNAHLAIATSFDWKFDAHGLVASHSYLLEFYWTGYSSASDYAYDASLTGASESASIAMAGPGLGATLESVTIR